MEAGDLTVFAAVARAGGITKAAKTLNTVQSTVTQRIRLLETELGVPLFHRHSRGVTLTSAGAQLLPYAKRIGFLIAEAKRAAADRSVPRGQITIGALETATAVRLPPVLAVYGAAYPEVDIEIHTGTSVEMIDAVLAHRLEAAFVAGPVSHPDLLASSLLAEELVVVTAPWITRLDVLTAPSAAGPIKVVVFRSGCSYRARLETLLARHGVVNVRRLEFGTPEVVLEILHGTPRVTTLLWRIHVLANYYTIIPFVVHIAEGGMDPARRRILEHARHRAVPPPEFEGGRAALDEGENVRPARRRCES